MDSSEPMERVVTRLESAPPFPGGRAGYTGRRTRLPCGTCARRSGPAGRLNPAAMPRDRNWRTARRRWAVLPPRCPWAGSRRYGRHSQIPTSRCHRPPPLARQARRPHHCSVPRSRRRQGTMAAANNRRDTRRRPSVAGRWPSPVPGVVGDGRRSTGPWVIPSSRTSARRCRRGRPPSGG